MTTESGAATAARHAEIWLQQFDAALRAGDAGAAAALFLPEGHWRDVLAFTWDIRTATGHAAIETGFRDTLATVSPRNVRLAEGRTPPRIVSRAGRQVVEALITFDTALGRAAGVVRLVDQNDTVRAWILLTTLEELSGHEARIGDRRRGDEAFTRDFGGENWLDQRRRAATYADREPAVLVVGAGQAGLSAAARLTALGVDTLLIDRHERIGDNWRKRYHSLTLHNEVHVNHLPYLPFPPTFPVFIPKDKLANWFEFYADALDLNVWTGTELIAGDYDETAEKWSVTLRRPDGGDRILRPRHIVFATGVSAIPVHPRLPGLEDFAGTVQHAASYSHGRDWRGRDVLVLGTGNSGHDIAQDLQASGARVTMIQRGTTNVVSLRQAQKVYGLYEEGAPVDDCDLLAMANPYPVQVTGFQLLTKQMAEADRDILDGLAARGFRLDDGDGDGTGFQMKYLRHGGGYYLDVGCSGLIADGSIGLLHYEEIDRFVAEGVRLKDGSVRRAELLVMATGYRNQQDVVRAFLNDAVADRIGPVWGYNDGGELANMWCRTPQPGLWFTAGSLAQCRIYSKYLALQIKACEVGLIGARRDGDVRAQAAE